MIPRKRVSDKEENIELRKEISELRKQLELLPQTKIESLTERQKRIVEHLRKNPGVSKESVIVALTKMGEGSRVTILKDIDNLQAYDIVSVRKDKKNSPAYKLYLNENSVFLSIYLELEALKSAFFNLVESLRHNKSNIETTRGYDLLFIYQHILGVLVTYSVLKWPNEIKDSLTLNKIYGIVFYQMIEIQNKIYEVFRLQKGMPDFNDATFGQTSNPALLEFINSTFLLEQGNMIRILENYGISSIKDKDLTEEKNGTKRDIVSLLAVAWKIGFPMYPYFDSTILHDCLPEDIPKFKDWRFAIANHMEKVKEFGRIKEKEKAKL